MFNKVIFGLVTAIVTYILLMVFAGDTFAAVTNWQKSASFYPMGTEDFASPTFAKSLKNFREIGGNYATLIITLYQENEASTQVKKGWNTPTDNSLKTATALAQSMGMKVIYKLHIDLENGNWRAYINPINRGEWFASYGGWANHYATLAKTYGAQELVLGAEYYNMTSSKINQTNTINWNNLIAGVRQNFDGKLTYSAQRPDGYHDEWNEIEFWGQLDYMGMSAYYPLGNNVASPGVNNYLNSWAAIDTKDFAPKYQQYKKPIVLTEIGYRSENNTHRQPWESQTNNGTDLTEQADLYQALLTYWDDKEYLQGLSIWDWSTNPDNGGNNDSGYTPQNKPAENIIKQWFLGEASQTLPAIPTSTPIATLSPTMTATPTAKPTQASTPGEFKISGTFENKEIKINVSNSGKIYNGVVDIEVFNNNWRVLSQKYYDKQDIDSTNKVYTIPWDREGNFRVSVGVFNSNWKKIFIWKDDVIVVKKGETPAIKPTNVPTSTPLSVTTPAISATSTVVPPTPLPISDNDMHIWWPNDGGNVQGAQPFKVYITNSDILTYRMFWQVDGGELNEMIDSFVDFPHKESAVDTSLWSQKADKSYVLNFVAKDMSGKVIVQKGVTVFRN